MLILNYKHFALWTVELFKSAWLSLLVLSAVKAVN